MGILKLILVIWATIHLLAICIRPVSHTLSRENILKRKRGPYIIERYSDALSMKTLFAFFYWPRNTERVLAVQYLSKNQTLIKEVSWPELSGGHELLGYKRIFLTFLLNYFLFQRIDGVAKYFCSKNTQANWVSMQVSYTVPLILVGEGRSVKTQVKDKKRVYKCIH